MKTYPFGDPDPVPQTGIIYPYWRFNQFTTGSEPVTWKMVVLENDYLRVKIFPQIGGKVWSIFDKTSSREMFYDNDVVKFRDISLRGPWTSGGIEFNYGVIGHAPSCASPVDWKTEKKEDGSVSCYIGVFEMLTRSHWTVEINLPKDAVWLRTTSTWHNQSSEYQPYYSWANSGVETADDLVLVYPSDNAIGHGGEKITYPFSEGRDLSRYSDQAYGDDKSFHMVGSHKSFFGAYYPSEDRGVMHWSLRDEKLGRKYFSWAQSRRGLIWVDLLTDTRPQYIEMQSGKLFNQNQVNCSKTSAYRQTLFSPFGTDQWSDYWLPYSGIGPADNVTLNAVTSVCNDGKRTTVGIFPLRVLKGEMDVYDGQGKIIFSRNVNLKPAKAVSFKFNGEASEIAVGGRILWTSDSQIVDRPQDRNPQFRQHSAEGQLMMARDYLGMRVYDRAETMVDSALASEPAMLGALTLKANLLFRRMQYEKAYEYSSKALAIDQYDPDAGYVGGLAAAALGRYADAMDRLEVAAISNSALRTSAFTELARLHFLCGDEELAAGYARKALNCNGNNFTAMAILHKAGGDVMDRIREADPLGHFADAEKLIEGKITAESFAASFSEEIAWEDYLELAVFYNSLGIGRQALTVLEALPEKNALTALWIAYLSGNRKEIEDAENCSLDFVFPFRRESYDVLKWAVDNGGGWQSRYLLAMLQDFLGNTGEAAGLMDSTDSDYAPYYAYRFGFSKDESDLRKALEIDPEGWRYCKSLSTALFGRNQVSEAVAVLEDFHSSHPDNVQISDALVEAYIAIEDYAEAEKILDRIVYLPFEGLRSSHDKYRNVKLFLAAEAIDNGQLDKAAALVDQALLWPERLGVGKPYDYQTDTSLEDWLKFEIEIRRSGKSAPKAVTPVLRKKLW